MASGGGGEDNKRKQAKSKILEHLKLTDSSKSNVSASPFPFRKQNGTAASKTGGTGSTGQQSIKKVTLGEMDKERLPGGFGTKKERQGRNVVNLGVAGSYSDIPSTSRPTVAKMRQRLEVSSLAEPEFSPDQKALEREMMNRGEKEQKKSVGEVNVEVSNDFEGDVYTGDIDDLLARNLREDAPSPGNSLLVARKSPRFDQLSGTAEQREGLLNVRSLDDNKVKDVRSPLDRNVDRPSSRQSQLAKLIEESARKSLKRGYQTPDPSNQPMPNSFRKAIKDALREASLRFAETEMGEENRDGNDEDEEVFPKPKESTTGKNKKQQKQDGRKGSNQKEVLRRSSAETGKRKCKTHSKQSNTPKRVKRDKTPESTRKQFGSSDPRFERNSEVAEKSKLIRKPNRKTDATARSTEIEAGIPLMQQRAIPKVSGRTRSRDDSSSKTPTNQGDRSEPVGRQAVRIGGRGGRVNYSTPVAKRSTSGALSTESTKSNPSGLASNVSALDSAANNRAAHNKNTHTRGRRVVNNGVRRSLTAQLSSGGKNLNREGRTTPGARRGIGRNGRMSLQSQKRNCRDVKYRNQMQKYNNAFELEGARFTNAMTELARENRLKIDRLNQKHRNRETEIRTKHHRRQLKIQRHFAKCRYKRAMDTGVRGNVEGREQLSTSESDVSTDLEDVSFLPDKNRNRRGSSDSDSDVPGFSRPKTRLSTGALPRLVVMDDSH